MRVALLAQFPVHFLPGYEGRKPSGHYASWLPQLSAAFEQEKGWEIHWIINSKHFVSEIPLQWRGQTFHFLHNPKKMRMLRGYWHDCRIIRQRLDAIQPELVHAWGTEDCYGMAAARCGRPWLLSMQGILLEYIRRVRMHPLVYIQTLYESYVLRRAQEITVESHWGAEVMRRLAPHAHLHLVEYGVQEPFFEGSWEPDPQQPCAIFAGTTNDGRKGVQDVVEAFASPALQKMQLKIVGDVTPPFARQLQARSTPNVQWVGRVPAEGLAEILRRAWCLVLPTRADTSPNVVKEARVIGLPVITTPDGGQSDYIRDGVNGFIVPQAEIATLTDRLTRILSDLAYTRQLGAALQEEQRAFFRPERTAELFLKLYADLAKQEPTQTRG